MKKRILAVVLALCMIASCCALYASAATYATGTFVEKIATNGTLTVDNIRAITKGTDFEAFVSVTPKTSITLNVGSTKVTADNVDDLFTFKKGTATLTYSGELHKYFDVSGSIVGDVATAKFADTADNSVTVYTVKEDIDTTVDTDVSTKVTDGTKAKYILEGSGTYSATVTKWVSKLSAVTMGVRFYGKVYDNLVASEIAMVKANVNRKNGGASFSATSSVTNKIEDLMPGDTVTLTATLKDKKADSEFYAFRCWVDGSGNVISGKDEGYSEGTDSEGNPTLTFSVNGADITIYACFVELKSRVLINYSADGKGSVIYNETREVFKGDAQISVMEGKKASFTFVPEEGYEVTHVYVDGKDVISFMSLINSTNLLKSLKILINASNKETYTYTFDDLSAAKSPRTLEVVFDKVEKLEAPSGKDMPTVPAEGLELETGLTRAGEGDAAGEDGAATTVPAEGGVAGNGGSAEGGIVNPATGSTSAIAVFAVMTVAAGAAFVTMKKKED